MHQIPVVAILVIVVDDQVPPVFFGAVVLAQLAFLVLVLADQRLVRGIGAGPVVRPLEERPLEAYLRRHVRPGDAFAVGRAGAPAFFLPLEIRVIDLNGLADAHIAHRSAQFPGGLLGRGDAFGKWDVDYVLAQDPRFVHVAFQGVAEDGSYLTGNTGQTLLANDPRFRARYERIQEPGFDGLFVRKDPGD